MGMAPELPLRRLRDRLRQDTSARRARVQRSPPREPDPPPSRRNVIKPMHRPQQVDEYLRQVAVSLLRPSPLYRCPDFSDVASEPSDFGEPSDQDVGKGTILTTTLIPPNEALEEAASGSPDDITDIVVLLGQWLNFAETEERASRYDRLIDSMYEWLEASGSASPNPLLRTIIRQAEAVQVRLHGSAEAARTRS
jgi:hypothetical protein